MMPTTPTTNARIARTSTFEMLGIATAESPIAISRDAPRGRFRPVQHAARLIWVLVPRQNLDITQPSDDR